MLTPTMPSTVGPLTQFTDVALRSLLTATHYALGQKLPLPEADREQWCMRLDSAIRYHNQMATSATTCTEWEAERQRRFKETGVMPFVGEVLMINGVEYKEEAAVKMSADIRCRAYQDMQTIMSLSAMLILDERAGARRSASPVICVAGTQQPELSEDDKQFGLVRGAPKAPAAIDATGDGLTGHVSAPADVNAGR